MLDTSHDTTSHNKMYASKSLARSQLMRNGSSVAMQQCPRSGVWPRGREQSCFHSHIRSVEDKDEMVLLHSCKASGRRRLVLKKTSRNTRIPFRHEGLPPRRELLRLPARGTQHIIRLATMASIKRSSAQDELFEQIKQAFAAERVY